MPRLAWKVLEEGKLTAILEGVKKATVVRKDGMEEVTRKASANVVEYLKMSDAGHVQYGWGFLGSQVCFIRRKVIIL